MTGCSSGTDAIAVGGSFDFRPTGGVLEFSYPAAERGTLGTISGPAVVGDGTVALADYRGKVVVLNFWGSWCGPCRAEAPDLRDASTELADLGVQFLGVNVKDDKEAAAAFEASKEIAYPSIFDPTRRTLLSIKGYPANTIPSTIVVDPQGRVAQIWLRQVTKTELVATVRAIATET
ncbi:redoxin domain-containing protein [Nakamurella sp. YIM 132087]|uniref:Redoxin domain-containing protein n=2 Tax=Nakamurella alba TaxID=2665158 RepID=A0A7K1FMF6_9ACTN|nr:redoxin domain-containing protein [Nakamurella alba]